MERIEGRRPSKKQSAKKKVVLGEREQRRLVQLAICLALFLAVFIGRGVFPDKMSALQQDMATMIQQDTDFQAAFAQLGSSVQAGESVVDSLGDLWLSVFVGVELVVNESAELVDQASYPIALEVVSPQITTEDTESIPVPEESMPEETSVAEPVEEALSSSPEPAASEAAELPAWGETVSPVMAVMSSPYGARVHPLTGEESFHTGVDLAAEYGTEIGAFADGVIDYIGESPVYGLYLQIEHQGGLTSFYAHCSELLVQQGQVVTAGETVALVGDTGEVTGAHLHFELKLDGERIDPVDYIETLTE